MQEGWRATIPVNEPVPQPLPHLQRRLPLEIVSLVCMPEEGWRVPRLVFLSSPPRRAIHERALGGCGFRDVVHGGRVQGCWWFARICMYASVYGSSVRTRPVQRGAESSVSVEEEGGDP